MHTLVHTYTHVHIHKNISIYIPYIYTHIYNKNSRHLGSILNMYQMKGIRMRSCWSLRNASTCRASFAVPWEFDELVWPVGLYLSFLHMATSAPRSDTDQIAGPGSVLMLSGEIRELQAWMMPLTSWLGFRRMHSSTVGAVCAVTVSLVLITIYVPP